MSSRLSGIALLLFALASAWYLRPGWYQRGQAYYFHYDYLADSFLEGHTDIDLKPDPKLLALPDPYDPAQNRKWRLGDASLYNGKYYLYFGPAPALVLFAPFKLLTGAPLMQSAATCAVAAAALGLLAWLVRDVLRRNRPESNNGSWVGAMIFAAMGSWLLVTLQRPMVFEVSIICGAGGFWAALFFLWKGSTSGRWILCAPALGLALAFSLASRITYAPAAVLILGAAFLDLRARPGNSRRNSTWLVFGAAAPVAACFLGLLVYNHARFGNAFEFGQKYQLNVSYEQKINPRDINPSFIPFNLREYLLAKPTISPFFPFILPQDPPVLPRGYIASEGMHGILIAVPVNLFALAGAVWIWRRRKNPAQRSLFLVGATCVICALADACILLNHPGTVSRYITELLAPVVPMTAIGLAAAFSSRSRLLRTSAAVLGVYSFLYVFFAATAAYDNLARVKHPRAYPAAAHACDAIADLFVGHPYHRSGPIELQLALRPFTGPCSVWIVSGGRPDARYYLTLTREDADHISLAIQYGNENDTDQLWLTHQLFDSIVLKGQVVPAPSGAFIVQLAAPWLYPPAEDGYWDPVPSSAKSNWLRNVVLVAPGADVGVIVTNLEEPDGEPLRINSANGQVQVVSCRYFSSSPAPPR
jgi:hypothetical protein